MPDQSSLFQIPPGRSCAGEDIVSPMTQSTPNNEIRIGVAGLGMAGSLMIPPVVAHPAFALAGAAEPNAMLRERFAADLGCATCADVADLVARDDIDALYVATPHQFHREHATLAANAGKHVLVEKPMALTVEDCDAMIEVCDRRGVRLVVGHSHSFDPSIQAMCEIIRSGRLGQVTMIEMFNYTDFLYRPRRPEELDTAKGGGVLYNQIPHQVDIARALAGDEVASVLASARILDPSRPTEGAVMAMLQFNRGASASIVYSGYDRFDSDEFYGWVSEGGRPKQPAHNKSRLALTKQAANTEELALRVDRFGYGGTAWQTRPNEESASAQPHFGIVIVSCEQGDLRQSPQGVVIYNKDGAEEIALAAPRPGAGRAEVLDEFAEAVRTGKDLQHSGRFARGTVQTCVAIARSSQTRMPSILVQ